MGVENILEKITLEASAAAESILSDAKKEAAAIVEETKKKASESYSKSLDSAEKEAIESINHIRSMAALEARKMKLAAKREVIDEVFAAAAKKLRNLPDNEYAAFLAAMANASAEKGTLWFSDRDFRLAEQVRPYFKGDFKISKTTVKKLADGFIIKNGSIQVKCSIDELLSVKRADLEPVAVKVLFAE